MKESRIILIIVSIFLAIFLITGFILVRTVQNTSQAIIDPIQRGSSQLGTQVAQFLHPTPTILPDPVSIIHEVRSLARLETIQYTVEKIITAQTRQDVFKPLFGDRLLFVAHGAVIAGVDLGKLLPEDFKISNGVLNVCLPEPEIFVTDLDNEKSYVYDRQTGILTRGDINLETAARKAAEEEIQNTAVQDGILKQARQNAESYLSQLFLNLGYQDVIYICPGGSATPTP